MKKHNAGNAKMDGMDAINLNKLNKNLTGELKGKEDYVNHID